MRPGRNIYHEDSLLGIGHRGLCVYTSVLDLLGLGRCRDDDSWDNKSSLMTHAVSKLDRNREGVQNRLPYEYHTRNSEDDVAIDPPVTAQVLPPMLPIPERRGRCLRSRHNLTI